MKKALITLAILTGLASTGCRPRQEEPLVNSPPPAQPTAQEQLARAQRETHEAADAIQDYAYTQKDAFIQAARRSLKKMEARIDDLEHRAERSSGPAKADARARIVDLRRQADGLNERLERVEDASEATWDAVKQGIRDSARALDEGVTKGRVWVDKQLSS